MHVKFVEAQSPPIGVVGNLGKGCQTRSYPRHFTMALNYEANSSRVYLESPHQEALQYINFCTVQSITKLPTGSPKMIPTWLYRKRNEFHELPLQWQKFYCLYDCLLYFTRGTEDFLMRFRLVKVCRNRIKEEKKWIMDHSQLHKDLEGKKSEFLFIVFVARLRAVKNLHSSNPGSS
ncbi:hypothetical protein TNCV_1129251 [Trichonephila clavipes]|nr:hypothetical protein TNCV_1129251 [Trichonephila clavipes]